MLTTSISSLEGTEAGTLTGPGLVRFATRGYFGITTRLITWMTPFDWFTS